MSSRPIKMEMTEAEAKALLRMVDHAETYGFSHEEKEAVWRAIRKLRYLLDMREQDNADLEERLRDLANRRSKGQPVCMVPDCGCIGEAHP